MLRNPGSQRRLFMGLGKFTQNEHFRNTQIWQSTKQGQRWRPFCEGSANKKVTKNLKKRALCYCRRTLSGISAPHLVVFLHYFDTILLGPNRSRLGCILLHSPGEGNGEGNAPASKHSARFAIARAPGGIYRGARGKGLS